MIVKTPKFEKVECHVCGTEFIPELGDSFATSFDVDVPREERLEGVFCPLCGYLCRPLVRVIDDEEPKTEGKKDEYFTLDQVRQMTREEVKKNYSAIMKSMEKWK